MTYLCTLSIGVLRKFYVNPVCFFIVSFLSILDYWISLIFLAILKFEENIHIKAIVNVSRKEHLPIDGKAPPPPFSLFPITSLFDFLRWAPFSLASQLRSTKLLQCGAVFIQKLTPGFKSHTKNLSNFRQAVERPKSWKSVG